MGDLNVDIYDLTKPRNNDVAALLATYGVEDMLPHFCQRFPFRHQKTWYQVQKKIMYRSRCDYILAGNRRKFQIVAIQDPRNFNSDDYMLLAEYYTQTPKCHKDYIRGRKHFPLKLSK